MDAASVAKAFGWTYPTYAGHENGSRGVKRDALMRYAKAYGVTIEWMMSGRGPKSRKGSDWEIDGEAYLPVPVYDISAAAGPSSGRWEPKAPKRKFRCPRNPPSAVAELLRLRYDPSGWSRGVACMAVGIAHPSRLA